MLIGLKGTFKKTRLDYLQAHFIKLQQQQFVGMMSYSKAHTCNLTFSHGLICLSLISTVKYYQN